MNKFLVGGAIVVGGLGLSLLGAVTYVKAAAADRVAQKMDLKVEAIPVPYPLDAEDRARVLDTLREEAIRNQAPRAAADATGRPDRKEEGEAEPPAEEPPLDPQLVAKALHEEAERLARERGERYLKSRAGCADCHGDDFGGKVIIDALPVMGRWVAPNITRGGVTRNYTSADWVRIIRHGIRKNGQVATMPARDFTWLSDQELSDMAVYIESLPPVDRVMPPSEFGPVFAMLITKGDFPIDAERIDHEAARPKLPPELAVTEELGRHLALTCQGCHGPRFAGGPIPGGDPSWPPAANLTPHESGLSGWSKDDFFLSLREGKRPDGRNLHPAMPIPYTKNLTDEETESLYRFFMDLEALPTGTM